MCIRSIRCLQFCLEQSSIFFCLESGNLVLTWILASENQCQESIIRTLKNSLFSERFRGWRQDEYPAEVCTITIGHWCLIFINSNPFNGLLSRTTWMDRNQKNIHSLTPHLCGYYTTSLINFLYVIQSIASSLRVCWSDDLSFILSL